jgi:nucleotide-binding universal stress UspA family protein
MGKILVPTDGSKPAMKALAFAIENAKVFGDEVLLINVQPNYETTNVKRFVSAQQIREYSDDLATEALKDSIHAVTESQLPFQVLKKVGNAAMMICDEAKQSGARCIVMGSRGNGPIVGKIIGSVSYSVLHHAPCPVIIVP